jgi:hypothetical protein
VSRPSGAAIAARGWLARLAEEAGPIPPWWHFLKLGEEAGESSRAFLRWCGMARERGTSGQLAGELADVVISAHACAQSCGLDLDAAVRDKGAELLTRDLGELTRDAGAVADG